MHALMYGAESKTKMYAMTNCIEQTACTGVKDLQDEPGMLTGPPFWDA